MEFEAFIFDMDDTIVELKGKSSDEYFDYCWFKGMGFNDEKSSALSKLNGRKERIAFLMITEKEYVEKYLPKYPPADYKIRQELIEKKKIRLMRGAIELLSSIKQPKALVSQAPGPTVQLMLEKFKLENFFKFVHFRDFSAPFGKELRKPDPKLAYLVCEKLGVKPSEKIAMVGNGERDAEFAVNAGLTSLIVFNSKINCDYRFKDLIELRNWLE